MERVLDNEFMVGYKKVACIEAFYEVTRDEDAASGLSRAGLYHFEEAQEWGRLHLRVLACICSGAHRFGRAFIAPPELAGCVEIGFAHGAYVCKVLAFDSVTVHETSVVLNGTAVDNSAPAVVTSEARIRLPALGFPDLDPEQLAPELCRRGPKPTSFGARMYIFPPHSDVPDVPADCFTVVMGRDQSHLMKASFRVGADGDFKPLEGKGPKSGHAYMLSAFASAAELGDASSLYLLFDICKKYVCKVNQRTAWSSLAVALDRYLESVHAACTHRTVSCDMNYFGVEAGEAHESAGEAYEAIASYKLAAQRAMAPAAPGTVVVPPDAQSFVWNCLGLALKRHGQLEMATRAYLWSLAVQGSGADGYRDCIQSLMNAIALMQAMPAERENRRQDDMIAIERQRHTVVQGLKDGASGGKIFTVIACDHCSKRRDRTSLKTCARCGIARYCDRACQQADWQSHKASCKAGKAAGVEAVP